VKELARRSIRDGVFGLEDGLVSTFGAVTGVAMGTGSARVAALSGLVIVAVESVSMAAGSYLSTKSHRELLEQLIREERRQIDDDPEGERLEIRRMYAERGWREEEIVVVERRLMSDKELLLEDMAHKELGVVPGRLESPSGNALVMGVAYVLGGALPAAPYLFLPLPAAVPLSAAATGLALFALGAAKGRLVGSSPLRSGLEMLGLGAGAGALGWLVGRAASSALG
jgi:VIT1/CCC1 family predicted Fe2+/Mn2+ transporter